MLCVRFDIFDTVQASNRVDRVLHRIGGDDFGVVALAVGGIEVTFEGNVHDQLKNAMAITVAFNIRQANFGFAVRLSGDGNAHGLL